MAAACAQPAPEPGCEHWAQVGSALIGGQHHGELLELDAQTESAVVQLARGDGSLCTGVVIAGHWVLTAKHCLHGNHIDVVISDGIGADVCANVRNAPVVLQVSHEALDIALLEVADDLGVRPIALNDSPEFAYRQVGFQVELAGIGETTDGNATRLFLGADVTAVAETEITVDAFQRSGACVGDSGGPALQRCQNGVACVVGILSRGSVSCRGKDTYTRVDSAMDWIVEVTGPLPVATAGCDGLESRMGGCFANQSVYCKDGALEAESCGERVCGWSSAESGYRCLPAAQAGCLGLTQFGECRDGEALTCRDGHMRRQRCIEPFACGRRPDGVADCLELGQR